MQVGRKLDRRRFLYVDENDIKYRGYTPPAYHWLQLQLAVCLPGYSGHLPWWAFCQKPDLRCHRHLLRKGEAGIRLELEIPDECLVRFPCWAWHRVFCQDYLTATREEYEHWTKALRRAVPDEDTWPLPKPWRARLEASWQRLFDPGLPLVDWDEDSPWSRIMCVEGVFEMLRLSDVRCVTSFRGTLSKR